MCITINIKIEYITPDIILQLIYKKCVKYIRGVSFIHTIYKSNKNIEIKANIIHFSKQKKATLYHIKPTLKKTTISVVGNLKI